MAAGQACWPFTAVPPPACRRLPAAACLPPPACRQCDACPPHAVPLQVKTLVPPMSQSGKVAGEVTQIAASPAANQIAVGHADGTVRATYAASASAARLSVPAEDSTARFLPPTPSRATPDCISSLPAAPVLPCRSGCGTWTAASAWPPSAGTASRCRRCASAATARCWPRDQRTQTLWCGMWRGRRDCTACAATGTR